MTHWDETELSSPSRDTTRLVRTTEGRVANSVTLTHMCSLHPKTFYCVASANGGTVHCPCDFSHTRLTRKTHEMCFFPEAATVTWGQKRTRERGNEKGSWRKRRIDINDFRGGRLSFSLEGRGKNFRRSPSGKRWYHVDTRARVELKGDNKNVRYCKARKKI